MRRHWKHRWTVQELYDLKPGPFDWIGELIGSWQNWRFVYRHLGLRGLRFELEVVSNVLALELRERTQGWQWHAPAPLNVWQAFVHALVGRLRLRAERWEARSDAALDAME